MLSTDPTPRRALERERQRRQRRVIGGGLLVVAVLGFLVAVYVSGRGNSFSSALTTPAAVTLVSDGRVVERLDAEDARRLAHGSGTLPLDPRRTVRRGKATLTVELDRALLRRQLASASAGDAISVSERVVEARIETPITKQIYRNNCETAALSMLLASIGVEKDQVQLQDEIARAEPLDPKTTADGEMVWGDPTQGFVGRPPGGGPAGGFGVFEQPVMELASRWAEPVNLTEKPAEAIYRRLQRGHAVMTWIGLSDGPYETWQTPEGREVTVNFGEHTVVLTGIKGDQLFVNDPLDGLTKTWTKAEFEAKWALLGRRAISL